MHASLVRSRHQSLWPRVLALSALWLLLVQTFSVPAFDAEVSIFDAICAGHVKEVAMLLKQYPGLVASKDTNGDTPLHYAAFTGHQEIVKLLLASGAEVNARDNSGATP